MEELDIMRRQLAEMKESLDTQKIVNDTLMRKIMKGNASWLNKYVVFQFVALPLTYLFFVGMSAWAGISQWYALIYLVFATIDSLLDWKTVRIPPSFFGTSSLVELRRKLIRQKRERFIQICVMLPLSVIWVAAFFTELYIKVGAGHMGEFEQIAAYGGIAGGIIGGILGFIAVILLYRKMQVTNDTLLKDLDNLERGE